MRPGNRKKLAIRFALAIAVGALAVVASGAWGLSDHIASAVDVVWATGGTH